MSFVAIWPSITAILSAELYDLENDPHEVNNLADDPANADIKKRLSEELDRWLELTNDPLTLPETELVKRLWPLEGIQPQTIPATLTEQDGFLHLRSATKVSEDEITVWELGNHVNPSFSRDGKRVYFHKNVGPRQSQAWMVVLPEIQ